ALRVQNRRLTAEKAIGRAIIGDSPAMRRVLEAVNRVGPKDITVLVRGDTGTGKELIASLIHAESRRASRPLVRFNCAASPGELGGGGEGGAVRPWARSLHRGRPCVAWILRRGGRRHAGARRGGRSVRARASEAAARLARGRDPAGGGGAGGEGRRAGGGLHQ